MKINWNLMVKLSMLVQYLAYLLFDICIWKERQPCVKNVRYYRVVALICLYFNSISLHSRLVTYIDISNKRSINNKRSTCISTQNHVPNIEQHNSLQHDQIPKKKTCYRLTKTQCNKYMHFLNFNLYSQNVLQ